MLDTLKLHVRDYEVTSGSEIKVQPACYDIATGELHGEYPLFGDTSGRVHKGSKAYLHIDDKCNLSIKPLPKAGVMCFLQFSVPKVYNGSNYHGVGREGAIGAVQRIEQELAERGFKSKLFDADISRVDTFRNIVTEEGFESYYSLFSLLKARQTLKRGYGSTWLVSNSQQEYCIYDKLVEMQERGHDITGLPANTMRFEHRLLSGEKIKAVYGFKAVRELVGDGFEVVQEKQGEAWRKSLFYHSPEDILIMGASMLRRDMKAFQARHPKTWMGHYLKMFGAYSLIERAGIEVVKEALAGMSPDRMKVWRAGQVFERARRDLELTKVDMSSNKTLVTLYQELKSKMLGECEVSN